MTRISTSRRTFLQLSATAMLASTTGMLFSRPASAEKFHALVRTAKKAGED
jgi:anaerobic selenocysteine-containing dehydrogenase